MKRHSVITLFLILFVSFLLTGCGKDKNLEVYREAMHTFYDDMVAKTEAIDLIDPSSDTAVDDFLSGLDDLDALFVSLAEMEVPKEFSGAADLADEASENMSQAVALYHNAFEGEEFDSYTAEAAMAYYERAMKRVEYIGDILSGEIPDDANVTVITEEESYSVE